MEPMDTIDDDFPLTSRHIELLKAPARMASTQHLHNFTPLKELSMQKLLRAPRKRKRKPESEHHVRHVIPMTWNLGQETTTNLMEDMGVSQIDEKSPNHAKQQFLNPTPGVPTQTELVPPGAPRVTHVPNVQLQINTSFGLFPSDCSALNPYAYIEPQGTKENLFFLSRRLPRSKAEVSGINYMDKLSDEMLLSIFRWLPKPVLVKCARVCKRWHRLAVDEALWRRLDLNSKILKKGVLGRVLQRGVIVLRLAKAEIRTPLFMDSHGVFNKQRFSKVQYLDLTMAVISTEGLEQLLSCCCLLRKLSLENCQLNDNICRYIGENVNLEVLNLSLCQGITENGLVPICNNLQRLDALNIAWTGMTRGAVLYLVICIPKSVTKLNLSGCRETLLDEDIQQLCNSCPGIKELDISDATLLTGQSVEYISTSLRQLEYIALSRCYHIMPSSLPLLGHIPTLIAVDVFGMLRESALLYLRQALSNCGINKFPFSSIARPTTGIRRTSIWGLRARDNAV